MLIVGLVALVISLFIPPDLFWLVYYVGTVFASSWGPVAFMSVWSDTITARAAFWGIVSGFAGNVVLRFISTMGWVELPSYFNPILVGGLLSFMVVILVSKLDKVTDIERSRRLELHQSPVEEHDRSKTRQTQWVTLSVAAFGLIVTIIQLVYYVYPYQSAMGTLIAGEHLNWFTAEAILALCWAGIFVPGSMIAYRVTGRAYNG